MKYKLTDDCKEKVTATVFSAMCANELQSLSAGMALSMYILLNCITNDYPLDITIGLLRKVVLTTDSLIDRNEKNDNIKLDF